MAGHRGLERRGAHRPRRFRPGAGTGGVPGQPGAARPGSGLARRRAAGAGQHWGERDRRNAAGMALCAGGPGGPGGGALGSAGAALSPLRVPLAPAGLLAGYNVSVPSVWVYEGAAAGERDGEPQGDLPLRKVRTPQGRPLGASREGATPGKCHREQTASGPGIRVRARVKRWGKSPPPGP